MRCCERIYFIWQIKYDHDKSSQVLYNSTLRWHTQRERENVIKMEYKNVLHTHAIKICALHYIHSMHATLNATQSHEKKEFRQNKRRNSLWFVYASVRVWYSNNNVCKIFIIAPFFSLFLCYCKMPLNNKIYDMFLVVAVVVIIIYFICLIHTFSVVIQSVIYSTSWINFGKFGIQREKFIFKKISSCKYKSLLKYREMNCEQHACDRERKAEHTKYYYTQSIENKRPKESELHHNFMYLYYSTCMYNVHECVCVCLYDVCMRVCSTHPWIRWPCMCFHLGLSKEKPRLKLTHQFEPLTDCTHGTQCSYTHTHANR